MLITKIKSKARICCALVIGVIIVLGNTFIVRADIAPPISPPGSDIKTNEQIPIRMIKEVVIMEVQALENDDWLYQMWFQNSYGGHHTAARITAEFHMRNRDETSITTDVWFPLTSEIVDENRYFEITDLRVFVEDQLVSTGRIETPNPNGAIGFVQPWASFEVTFPPKEKLIIRVEYAIQPQTSPGNWTGISFSYIFQTGAGWYGTIGEATLIFRTPYEISNETIITLPPNGKVKKNEVVWTWKDFEPSQDDDFSIRLIRPDLWYEVETARDEANTYPDDADAWVRLAKAYQELSFEKGVSLSEDNGRYFAELGIEAYQTAIDIDSDDPTSHIGLAELLLGVYYDSPSQTELWQVWNELNQAIMLSNNSLDRDEKERVNNAFSSLEFRASDINLTFPTLGPSPTHGPSITPKPTSTPKPTVLKSTPTAQTTEAPTESVSPTQTLSNIPEQSNTIVPTNIQAPTLEGKVVIIATDENIKQGIRYSTNVVVTIGVLVMGLVGMVFYFYLKLYRK